MEKIPDDVTQRERFSQDVFLRLIQGLDTYLKTLETDVPTIPSTLRYALNALAFAAPRTMPKTLHRFIQSAQCPVSGWYPLSIPEAFNPAQPLLSEYNLSEEAQEFHLDLMERLQLSPTQKDIPQTALDNLPMRELRIRLKSEPDQQMAQQLYENVRLFLIQHSWTKLDQLRELPPEVFKEVRVFYDEMPEIPTPVLHVCKRCGLLVWRDGGWDGIKPHYCSDHAADSPNVNNVPNQWQLYRLKVGVHLQVFIPGRIELALFELAEEMQANYAEQFVHIERYPGIDSYDLRLTFRDEDIWAVDAKDQAYPKRLASKIQLPYSEGNLAYTHAFFVIPDERLEEDGYWEALDHAIGSRPKNLTVMAISGFKQRLQDKLNMLAKPPHAKKAAQTTH